MTIASSDAPQASGLGVTPAGRRRLWIWLRKNYLEADTRALALFRIVFGVVLIGYLISRITGDSFIAFQTNLGVYPNHYALFHPYLQGAWSLLDGLSTPLQVGLGMTAIGAVFVCFAVGYRTRLFTALSLVALISLHYRMPLMVNGSMVMMHLLLVWSLALPLGRHYSVDAWLRRRRGEPEPALPGERVTSLGVLGFRLQLFCIYFFNVVHKTGKTWRDGTAVHYVLWQDRIAMWPAVWLRNHEPHWFSPTATYGTLVIESTIAFCLLSPLFPKYSRRVAAGLMLMLHWGIGILVDLGPFPAVFPSAALLMMSAGDWTRFDGWVREHVEPRLQRLLERLKLAASAQPREPTPARRAAWRAGRGLREAYYVFFIVVIGIVMRHDNPFMKKHFGPIDMPVAVARVAETLYIPQGWSLFAPEAPKFDGMFVLDGVLADGTRVDPLQHKPPDFDVMKHGPFHTDYFWQTYVPVLILQHNADLWRFFMDYALRIPSIEHWKGSHRFVYLAAYYVGGERPRLDGKPVPPPKVTLYAVRGKPPPNLELPPNVPRPPTPPEKNQAPAGKAQPGAAKPSQGEELAVPAVPAAPVAPKMPSR